MDHGAVEIQALRRGRFGFELGLEAIELGFGGFDSGIELGLLGIGFGFGFGFRLGRVGLLEVVDSGLEGVVDGAEVFFEVLPLEGKVGDFGGVGLEEVEGFAEVWGHREVAGGFLHGGGSIEVET